MFATLATLTLSVPTPPAVPAPVLSTAALTAIVVGIVGLAKLFIPQTVPNRTAIVRAAAVGVSVAAVLAQTYLPASFVDSLGTGLGIAAAAMGVYQVGMPALTSLGVISGSSTAAEIATVATAAVVAADAPAGPAPTA